ncbi:hypothetical protein L5F50_00870 [Aliarcobacter butzleri]|nr:hypothetical protein [Aliarcobacter butzleri]
MSKKRNNQWKDIPSQIKIRFLNAHNSIFLCAFIFMLLTIGALGVWIPPIRFEETKLFNSESLFTYAGPILAMLLVEYFVQAERSKLAALSLIVGIVACICIGVGYYIKPQDIHFLTIFGTILTLILITLVNANDEKFDEKPTPEDIFSPTGHVKAELSQIRDKE